MQPTRIGAPLPVPDTAAASDTAGAEPAALSLPANFPVELSPAQSAEVSTQLERMSLAALPARDIALLGSETEASLHRALGAFLQRIEKTEPPRIFKLVTQLGEAVDREDLPGLAERILDDQPGLLDKVAGFFSRKALAQAAERNLEDVRALATGKCKRLSELITMMEHELRSEQVRLDAEVRSLEQLKTDYCARLVEFAQLAAFMHGLLETSRIALAQLEADPQADPSLPGDLRGKLEALESRAQAIEGALSRLPTDPAVIRQLRNAGTSTVQETSTTAASRFASIKTTLLTVHGALVGDEADGDASVPGELRRAQAQPLKAIAEETRSLVATSEQARQGNAEQVEGVRTMLTQAREEMVLLSQAVRPEKPFSS